MKEKMKEKITVYTRYDENGASSRMRYYKYLPYLHEQGMEAEAVPLFDGKYLKSFYSKGSKPIFRSAVALARRYCALRRMPDAALIEYELMPFATLSWELKKLKKTRYVINFDDNVWMKYAGKRYLLDKYDGLTANAAGVIAGNEFLFERVKRLNSNAVLIPTAVDLEEYRHARFDKFKQFTLCWIGNPATYHYLEQAAKYLREIGKRVDFELLVVAGKSLAGRTIPGVRMRFVDWTPESEKKYLAQSHIGIMPLPADDEFARGKSAYKLIQYMASGIPAVASPVGENVRIMGDSAAGILAETPEEWADAVEKLAFDDSFYTICADNARRAAQDYSLEKYSTVLGDFLKKSLF